VTTLNYLTFPDLVQTSEANKQLARAQVILANPDIVDLEHIGYDVESYFIVDGLPVADTQLGIAATCVVESGDLAGEGAYPFPFTVDTGADARWLALDGTFPDGQLWAPYSGSAGIRLDADGTSPVMVDDYEYLLGKQFANGPAFVMSDGDYFFTDELRWGATSVTVAIVAVLDFPMLDSYGLLETYPPDSVDPDRPFVSLRYTRAGAVQTHILGLQAVRQTASQAVRTGQPVIAALQVIPDSFDVNVVIVDRTLTSWTTKLTGPHPYDARMLVGRSPGIELGTAEMALLEVDYWTDLDYPAMLAKVNVLDRLYGVSRL